KSPHAKESAFSPEVCNAIRHHLGEIAALESQRDLAFDDRDHAADAIAKDKLAKAIDASDGLSVDEITQYKSQHSDAVREIDELKEAIKFHQAELQRTVKNADAPGLEVLLERPLPPPAPKKPDPEADAPGQLVLGEDAPSGQAGESQTQGSGDVLQPDFHIPAGVDQHMQASVRELQLEEKITTRLIGLGFVTIGRIAALLDSGAMLDDCGMSGPHASKVTAAVNAYRRTHRKAMHEVELGGEQPAAGGSGEGVPHDRAGGRGAKKGAKKVADAPADKPAEKPAKKSGRKGAGS
ncbi:MAG: hypothetical protein EBZ59_09265, partial [Planctomycetia bacterium]|nr:hypothetical protein [Planctomycetia bacterium]